jgi:hypothetical protein
MEVASQGLVGLDVRRSLPGESSDHLTSPGSATAHCPYKSLSHAGLISTYFNSARGTSSSTALSKNRPAPVLSMRSHILRPDIGGTRARTKKQPLLDYFTNQLIVSPQPGLKHHDLTTTELDLTER